MGKAKNIVICCDGTNNQIESSPTNVFVLFQALKNIPGRQETLYLPGVGTMAAPGLDSPIRRRLSIVGGLAFGSGLQSDYEEAYRFLMQTYAPGDRIYIFGFSRGSLTARAVAGMLHMFGLLRPGQEGLIPYIGRHYAKANFEVIRQVRRFTRRRIKVEFLGLWDTVASYGFAFSRRTLPFTANNRDIKVVRHALAIDERRAYFRAFRWGKKFSAQTRKGRDLKPIDQDVREVWFPGVHSDVGGGYNDGHLSRIPLEWMLAELRTTGARLRINPRYMREAFGISPGETFVPDPCSVAHESLSGAWWPMELLPKNGSLRRGQFEWPFGRRRHMFRDPQGLVRVHESVFARRAQYGSEYRPLSLADDEYEREPWSGQKPAEPRTAPLPELPNLNRARSVLWSIGLLGLLAYFASSVLWSLATGLASYRDQLTLFLLPVVVLYAGSWVMNALSGLSSHSYKLRQPLVYRAWGYDVDDLKHNIRQLDKDGIRNGSRDDGIAAFRRALGIDLGFPLVYGLALWFTSVTMATLVSGTPLTEQPELQLTLLGVVPAVTMLADWIENGLLLTQVRRAPFEPNEKRVAFASHATKVKLASYAACTALPPLIWLVVVAWRSFA